MLKGVGSGSKALILGPVGPVGTLAPELQASQPEFLPELEKEGKFFNNNLGSTF